MSESLISIVSDGREIIHLAGRDLGAITFVRDYIQLHFDGPTINAITSPVVTTGGRCVTKDDAGYRDALCQQIGKEVVNAFAVPEQLTLEFADHSAITVSLRREDLEGRSVEAALLIDGSHIVQRVW